MLLLVGAFALSTLAGCSKLTFLPQPRTKAKPAGYAAVVNGMNEAQVRAVMGAPARRSGVNLEGSRTRGVNLTYVANQSLVTVTLVGNQVIAKQKF
jgi:hypothetical protein